MASELTAGAMLHEEGIKLVATSLVGSNSPKNWGLNTTNLHITVTSWCGCQMCSGVRRRCRRVLNAGAQNMSVYMVCVTVVLGDVCVT